MPRDLSGNYTLPLGNPVIDGTTIDTSWANPTMSDIAVQLNNVVTRDGLLGFTSPAFFVDGTSALPGIAFAAQNSTGIWRDSTKLGFSYAGITRLTLSNTGLATFTSSILAGGQTTPTIFRVSTFGVTPGIQTWGPSSANAALGTALIEDTSVTATSYLFLARARGTTAARTIIQANDGIARIVANGFDGTQYTEAAQIRFSSDGTPGLNDMPGKIEFLTTPDGGVTPTLVLTLKADSSAYFASALAVATSSAIPIPANVTLFVDAANPSVLPAFAAGTVFVAARSGGATQGSIINVVSGNAATAGIRFGDSDAAVRGAIDYNNSTETLDFRAGGTAGLFQLTTLAATFTVPVKLPVGAVGAPSLTSSVDATTGLWFPAANEWALAQGGTNRLRLNSTQHVSIQLVNTAPLAANMQQQELTFSRISDTSLRVSMKGSDNVVRNATITLA